nr:nucleoside-diphosphate sugar epimerase/dehydratase [Mesorhizobium sp.]
MPRKAKRSMFVVFDVVLLLVVVWCSFSIGLNDWFVPDSRQALLILAAPSVALPIFIRTGLYRSVLRYLPERAVWTIFTSVTAAAVAWAALVFLAETTGITAVPGSVALVYWALSMILIAGSRIGAKKLLWSTAAVPAGALRTLIYGTGNPAIQLVNALTAVPERNVMGFVSDDESLAGMEILGLRVYPMSRLDPVVRNFGIDEIIVTIQLPNGAARRELIADLGSLPVRVRILPAIADLASGKYLIGDVRDIDIDDLLGRSAVPADPELMRDVVAGRVILITGAAGSIGAELCRTVARLAPRKLILMDFNEHGLYEIAREIGTAAEFPVSRLLGSVTNASLVRHILSVNKVDTVYHCAAYKHVSMVEANCLETTRNNILGTWAITEAAHECGVKNFVLISSDKAVRPANVMGATKRWSELIVQHFGFISAETGSGCNFSSVRFGNVIGSSGSVVPLFREQIAQGGPVTLTHEGMTRYFMSGREAAELIVQATGLAEPGDVLMLEMGEPVKIRRLAEDMIMLAGQTIRTDKNPDGDIEIAVIGIKSPEKLHEELFYDPSGVTPTSHPKILRDSPSKRIVDIPAKINRLRNQIEAGEEVMLRKSLFDFT